MKNFIFIPNEAQEIKDDKYKQSNNQGHSQIILDKIGKGYNKLNNLLSAHSVSFLLLVSMNFFHIAHIKTYYQFPALLSYLFGVGFLLGILIDVFWYKNNVSQTKTNQAYLLFSLGLFQLLLLAIVVAGLVISSFFPIPDAIWHLCFIPTFCALGIINGRLFKDVRLYQAGGKG